MKHFYNHFSLSFFISLIILIIINCEPVRSQRVTDYNFTAESGSFAPLVNGTEVGSVEADDQLSGEIPIGFDFWYLGARYNMVFAASNGYLSFDNLTPSSYWTNDLWGMGHATGNGRPAIAPLWDDLDGSKSESPTSKASYQTSGSAPNRIFTFEWLNWEWNKNANQPVISFQVKLYETSGKIEFVYRQESGEISSGSASIGITDKLTGDGYFLSLDGSGSSPSVSSAVETNTISTKPATGQIYRFIPIAPTAPSGLTFTDISKTEMILNWTDNSNNENGFAIYHSTDNIDFAYFGGANSNALSYIASNLGTGITHYWKVYSLRDGLSSTAAEGSRATANGSLSGIKKIGGVGSNYSSLSSAINDINFSGLAGPIVLEIQEGYTSDNEWFYPITLNNLGTSAERPLTIRPASTVSAEKYINASSGEAIRLDDANYVTIDGRPGGSGTDVKLYLVQQSNDYAAVTFMGSSSNNTIKYCHIRGRNALTNSGLVKFTDVLSSQSGQNNNVIEYCDLYGQALTANIIYSYGTATPDRCNKNNIIRNNKIRDFYISTTSTGTTSGIYLSAGNSGWTISNNSIYQTAARSYSSTLSTHYGIFIGNTSNFSDGFIVENNFIGGNDINCGGTAWTITSGNYNLKSIFLDEPINTIVRNNKIANLALQEGSITGILVQDGSGTLYNNQISLGSGSGGTSYFKGIESINGGPYNFYYNTVYIGGTNTSGANNSFSFVRSEYAPITLQNNILFNDRTGGTGFHYAIGNILTEVSTGYQWLNDAVNYNCLVSSNSNYVGKWGNSSYTLSGWKTISGSDNNSFYETTGNINSAQLFNSLTDMHINQASPLGWYLNGKGKPVSLITTDYDSDLRSCRIASGSSDIGADEFTPVAEPPHSNIDTPPANSSSSVFSFAGNSLCTINWGPNGVVPGTISMNYYSGTVPPGSLAGNYSNCYWEITPGGGSGYTYDLVIHYDESQLGTISSENLIRIAKRDGGEWQQLEGSIVDVINKTVTISGLTSFSQFTLTDASAPLPVELSSFISIIIGRKIELNWETKTEKNSNKFEIECKLCSSDKWVSVGSVKASFLSNTPKKYSFTQKNLQAGKYQFRLKMIDNDGTFEYSKIIEADISIPKVFEVSQNYPNPFNPSTKIDYQIPFDGNVKVELYQITGKKIRDIIDEPATAGFHNIIINGEGLSSGIYFYRISVTDPGNGKNQSIVRKMIFLK